MAKKMKMYRIEERETGTLIEECFSEETAKEIIKLYEEHDKSQGTYTCDFYVSREYEISDREIGASAREKMDRDLVEWISCFFK